jgi:hypothetical protein
MKTFLFLLSFALLGDAAAQSAWIGKTEAELLALKGKPKAKTVVGTKAIYRWPDMEVRLTDGKVTSANPRNRKVEEELRQHSQKASAEAAQKKQQTLAKEQRNRMINEQYLADAAKERANAAEAERLVQLEKAQQDWRDKDKEQKKISEANTAQSYTQERANAEQRQKNPDVYDQKGRLIKK